MKRRPGQKIKLTSVEELLGVNNEESAIDIEIVKIRSFRNHPFKVIDDDKMQDLVESIRTNGILSPVLVRPIGNDIYEMVSGHRRMHAASLLGMESIPAIIREMTDDEAIVKMVDANIQREELLPSEKAFAYKMKFEAMKRRAGRPRKENSTQIGWKFETAALVGKELGESKNQIRRFIRLTELIPEIRDMVDEKKIAFNPAVELSYLKPDEQREFLEAMDYAQAAPSLSQAQRLKKMSQEGKCRLDRMCEVMSEEKKDDLTTITISHDVLRKYFPRSYTPQQMQDVIVKLLDQWMKKRNRDQTR